MPDQTASAGADDWFSVEELFGDPSLEPKGNWFAFNNPGDSIAGELVMEPYQAESNFGPQWVYVLKTKEGDVNVGIQITKSREQIIRTLKPAEVGDVVAFRFSNWFDSGKGNQGKNIEVRVRPKNK